MSILAPILKNCLTQPMKIATIDDSRKLTYGKLGGGAMFLAELIEQNTAKPNVGILLPTSGAFAMTLLGCWIARKTAVPFNYLLSHEELQYVMNDSEVDTIITAGMMLDALKLHDVIPSHIKVVKLEDQDFTGLPPLRWPPLRQPDTIATILYTSGTSGRPKGVMLTHDNFHANVQNAMTHARIQQAKKFLGVLPQFHSFGLTGLTLLPLTIGATVVYSARFIPKNIIRLMREHQPDFFLAVPSMYGALLSVKDAAADDFASIDYAITGGEPLPQAIFDAYQERFHIQLREGYGLTETAPIANWSTPWDFKLHSVGKALPGITEIIVDDRDRILPPNQDGEILIAGPNIMQGYFKLPDQTQAVFVDIDVPGRGQLKFFRTGDIGRLDDEGNLFITGRKKEMLIIGGENVFPREIEEILNRHEHIRDSAVIGKADGMRGEVPVAYVELADTITEKEFDPTQVRNWLRQSLAPFKIPREIHALTELPRSPTGKILRRQLKEN